MINRIIVTMCFLFTMAAQAQEGTSSPYSFYGLGENRFKGTVDTRAMGGISVLPDSIHLNLQNPAFYSDLKLTTFSVAGTYGTTTMKTDGDKEKARRSTLDYLAVGFPMGKFAGGFGLMPYTSVGYKLQRPSTDADPVSRQYNGEGGLNKVFFGASYEFTPKFSFGVELAYHFGEIETTALYKWNGVNLGTRETNLSSGGGLGMTMGAAYKTRINNKYDFRASMAYGIGSEVSFDNQRSVSTIQFFSSGSISAIETEDIDVADTKVKIPSRLSFGAGFGYSRKWMVGAELTFMQNKDLNNRFADIANSEFENAIKFSVGGYYIPNYNSYTSYFSRVVYRGGLRFEKTGLIINGQSINDTGLTFGIGLPLGTAFSNVNLSAEFGKRGTTSAGLVQENYANFGISLSLNDRWFVKRKYD